jgi:arylsulfatase A-like enzyme
MASAQEPVARGPRPVAPVFVHAALGVLGAGCLALADVVVAAMSEAGTRVAPWEFGLAGLHLAALYLPIGLLGGLMVGALVGPIRAARWLVGVRARLFEPSAWLRRDPVGFGAGLAALGALAVALLLGRAAHGWVVSSVHREELAGWAIGGVTAAAVPVALLTFVVLSPVAAWTARGLGRLASIAGLGALVLGSAAVGLGVYLSRHVEVRQAYGLPALLWGPLALVVHSALGFALASRLERWSMRHGWRSAGRWGLVVGPLLVAGLALLATAGTYGERNRVRGVVEQRSVLGRRLVRMYAAYTDRDGDRYTWAFGGGDCDDGDPSVHPGARDPVGDGIDADCFAGDGGPEVALPSDGRFGARPAGLPARPNFLVVTVDALRRDHLAINGYARDTSPELDRFLASAVQFDDVIPQSSRSLRSIPAMWIGRYASEIAFGPEYLWPSLLPENPTLPELLASRGYRTSAVVATNYFERVSGFLQGFEDALEADAYVPPRAWGVDRGLERLERLSGSGQPWLLWVHLFNCHQPYLEDGAPSRFGPEQVDFYDTEIGLAGRQVQRLLDALEQRDLADSTVVVLASDHGEAFGEHGSFSHSTTLYEEEMRPILALRVPGVAPGRVDGLVGLLDVAPTLANLAGVELEAAVSGQSLVPFLDGSARPEADRVVFAELLPDGIAPYDIKVARRGDEKLLWWVRDGTFQFFDLAEDPGERADRSDERRAEAEELLGLLRGWLARSAREESATDRIVSSHVRRRAWTYEHPVEIDYDGLFTVTGIDLPDRVYHPGERIPLTFYYRVEGETERDLFFVADLIGPPGARLPAHFHAWHYPIHSHHHTDRWERGTYIRDPTPIVVPRDVPAPVELTLTLTVRDNDVPVEGVRGGVRQGTFELARIRIAPVPAADVRTAEEIDAGVPALAEPR